MLKSIIFLILFGILLFPLMARSEIQANQTPLSEQETQLIEWIQARQPAMLKD